MPAHGVSIDDLMVECIIEFCVPIALRIDCTFVSRSGEMKERRLIASKIVLRKRTKERTSKHVLWNMIMLHNEEKPIAT